jgi:hypothetical protein
MENKYQKIQEEIDKIMSSKSAKFSDKQLESHEKSKEHGMKGAYIGLTNSKKVSQYDLNGNYIQTFESISDACRFIERAPRTMREHLQGKTHQCGGFVWKLEN